MKEFTRHERLMGSHFTLGIVSADSNKAEELLNEGVAIIKNLEKLLSEFTEDSETTKFNNHLSTDFFTIEKSCYDLINRCINISKLTHGDFDITIGAIKKLYQFKKENFSLPSADAIQDAIKAVGYNKLLLGQTNRIRKKHIGLKLSFAAVGKGYAADVVKQRWISAGVDSGYINASGDLCAWGLKPDGMPWNIGIRHPDKQDQFMLFIPLPHHAIATSGDYEQFFMHQGIRYAHNINPKTGKPIQGIKSVSVISPSAELSDALATAVFVKGIAQGLAFIEQLPQTHCIIINDQNELFLSKHLQYEVVAS